MNSKLSAQILRRNAFLETGLIVCTVSILAERHISWRVDKTDKNRDAAATPKDVVNRMLLNCIMWLCVFHDAGSFRNVPFANGAIALIDFLRLLLRCGTRIVEREKVAKT